MTRRRFFIPQNCILGETAVLPSDQAHHLRNVLRLQPGDKVELFDGEGRSYFGRVEALGAEIRVRILEAIRTRENRFPHLVLAAALIKADRFEWILQKGTELGAWRFLPLETRFTSVHIPQARLEARLERWQRIVREASRQCGRAWTPGIMPPLAFPSLLEASEYAGYARYMLHEKEHRRLLSLKAGFSDGVLLCVGPEGGWDESETQAAETAGFQMARIGSNTLRAETAAIAAVAVFQFLLENLQRQS